MIPKAGERESRKEGKTNIIRRILWVPGARLHPTLLKLKMLVSQSRPTLRPHGQYPASPLCPWNSPGKNPGVGCHFLLQGLFLTEGLNSGLLHCTLMGLWNFPLEGQAIGAFIRQLSSPLAEGCLGAGAQCPLLCFWAPSALESPCCLGLGYQLPVSLHSPDTSPLQLWLQPEVGPSRSMTLGTRDTTTAQNENTQMPI